MNIVLEMLVIEAMKLWRYLRGQKPPKLEATYIVGRDRADIAKGMNSACNSDPSLNYEQFNLCPVVKDKVWIYNVSKLSYTLSNALFREMKVPACTEGDYAVVTSFPGIMRLPSVRPDADEIGLTLADSRRVAMDLINPSNVGIDQDVSLNPRSNTSYGNDYGKRGVFFSAHNPPLKREIKAAHKRMLSYYTMLREQDKAQEMFAPGTMKYTSDAEIAEAKRYVEALCL